MCPPCLWKVYSKYVIVKDVWILNWLNWKLAAGFPFEVGNYGKSDVDSKILGPSSSAEPSAELAFILSGCRDVVFDEWAWWVLPLNQFVALCCPMLPSINRLRLLDISTCLGIACCLAQAMVVGIPRFIFISPDGNLLEDCEEVAQSHGQKDSYKRLLCVRCWAAVMDYCNWREWGWMAIRIHKIWQFYWGTCWLTVKYWGTPNPTDQ